MNTKITSYVCFMLITMVFVTSYFVIRIPALNEPLFFEEGIFADLIVNRPDGPWYSLQGRIDGEKKYGYISHPAASYELLRLAGFVFQRFLGEKVYLNDSLVSRRLRIITSLYQFFFYLFLLFYFYYHRSIYGKWPVLIIFAVALSPLAIKTSVHLQIDNTAGVVLCGIAAFLFLVSDYKEIVFHKRALLLLAGGFVGGLGKQEWSFALLLSLLFCLFLLYFIEFELPKRKNVQMLCCVAAGLLMGNLVSYLYDPINYTRALHYIVLFSKLHETSSGSWDFMHWLMLTKNRLPYIFTCIVLLVPGMYVLIFKQERHLGKILIILYGFFLFLEYALSDWSDKLRYFCPCLSVLLLSAIIMTPGSLPRWLQRGFLGAVFMIFVTTAVFIRGFVPNRNLYLEGINSGLIKSSPGTILFLDSGAGWNKPEIDYVNNNTIYDRVKHKIHEEYGKELIKPENLKNK